MVWISSQTGQKSQSKGLDIQSDWVEVLIQLYGYPVRLDRRPFQNEQVLLSISFGYFSHSAMVCSPICWSTQFSVFCIAASGALLLWWFLWLAQGRLPLLLSCSMDTKAGLCTWGNTRLETLCTGSRTWWLSTQGPDPQITGSAVQGPWGISSPGPRIQLFGAFTGSGDWFPVPSTCAPVPSTCVPDPSTCSKYSTTLLLMCYWTCSQVSYNVTINICIT